MDAKLNATELHIKADIRGQPKHLDASLGNIQYIYTPAEVEDYTGPHEVTPSRQEQKLETAGKLVHEDVIIAPIPKNYGLITYNGFEITVS